MSRVASGTGLIAARVRPVRRPKKKKRVELQGSTAPAPFVLRPFAGLFNPYPYGCSVLCNHPADHEAKEVVRKAKDTWASEGSATIPPTADGHATLRAHRREPRTELDGSELAPLPEELFRRYTETDSRPPSPASPASRQAAEAERPASGRATLVLDLRAGSQENRQEAETQSWRALTLEPIPSSWRDDLTGSARISGGRKPQISSRHRSATVASTSPPRTVPKLEISDAASTRSAPTSLGPGEHYDEEDEDADSSDEAAPMRRRGRLRRKKRKCRRDSIYGQQTEVRELPEPSETQISQVDGGSRRESTCTRLEETKQASLDKTTMPAIKPDVPPSFLPAEILKELSRELDRETVEWEFNAKRRFALEEALRVIGEAQVPKPSRQNLAQSTGQNVPRLFYRQSARFELLDSQSLVGLKPLDYLGRHVYVSEARKALFGRVFNQHREDTSAGPRYMLAARLPAALADVLGRGPSPEDVGLLDRLLGRQLDERLDFRSWCGLCAFAERALVELPGRSAEPPTWLERADFEGLERRLSRVEVHAGLAEMLRIIRER